MKNKLSHFEKYSIAPSSRDYYGIRVFPGEVILYQWKVSHGPHLLPLVRTIKFSDFNTEECKPIREEIKFVFGFKIINYLELVTSEGINTLLTLPKGLIDKLVKYLSLRDIGNLLCVSQISCEIFNANSVWEIILKRLKRSSELSEMEKDIGGTEGFKKLVRDRQIRCNTRKTLKLMDDKSARSQNPKSNKNEKIFRSSSVSVPKTLTSHRVNIKNEEKKQNSEATMRKIEKTLIMKSSVEKSLLETTDKTKINLIPKKKSVSEERSSSHLEDQIFQIDNNAAGENYRVSKSTSQTIPKTKSSIKQKNNLGKFKFVTEDQQKAELILPKKYVNTMMQADFSGLINFEKMTKRKATNLLTKSPRSIFTKSSNHNLDDIKSKSSDKTFVRKKSKSKSKVFNSAELDLKSLVNDGKNDDLDKSGMSYLMKRYLEASNEVARKFSECEKLAHTTKNSSIQVDITEKVERRTPKKLHKLKHTTGAKRLESPLTSAPGSSTNVFSKLKSLRKN